LPRPTSSAVDATPRQVRRTAIDAAVKQFFDASDGRYGSPRVLEDLVEAGWRSKKTVEASMARQGLVARSAKRPRRWLTRPDKAAPPAPDLVKRDFTAPAINLKWCGDLTEVPAHEGKLYLATVEDLALETDRRVRTVCPSRRRGRHRGVEDGRRRARRPHHRHDLPFR
jgi:transposase InsO family protein